MNISRIQDLADEFGIDWAETTEGTNGYPTNLKPCLTSFNSISQFEEVEVELKSRGYEVTSICIRQKDGWALWNWSSCCVKKGMYCMVGDNDWSVEVDPSADSDEVAFNLIVSGREFSDHGEFNKVIKHYEDFSSDLSLHMSPDDHKGTFTVFYNPDNNYMIERVANDETTGFYKDTWMEQIAMFVEFNDGEDEA